MLDNETVDRFIDGVMKEINELDARLQEGQAALEKAGQLDKTGPASAQAQSLMAQAKEKAQAEGRARAERLAAMRNSMASANGSRPHAKSRVMI